MRLRARRDWRRRLLTARAVFVSPAS
jgi:ribosomal protein S30